MAEGIKIEIFKLKNADELTRSLADPESRIETGSGAAMTAALATALCAGHFKRATRGISRPRASRRSPFPARSST